MAALNSRQKLKHSTKKPLFETEYTIAERLTGEQRNLERPNDDRPDPNQDRNAYFGDLHVHTRYSFDAYAFGTVATPYDAYREQSEVKEALEEFTGCFSIGMRRSAPLNMALPQALLMMKLARKVTLSADNSPFVDANETLGHGFQAIKPSRGLITFMRLV